MILDDKQKEIVDSKDNNIIVVAGAGSGKTRVLTERVKRLINEGTDPSNMIIITFTNMAADEMRERLVEVEGIGDAFIGTIHSFANKILQNSDEIYEIYTEEKENQFARVIIRRHCKFLTFDRFIAYKDIKYKYEMGLISEDDLNSYLLPSERDEIQAIFASPNEEFPQTIKSMCELEGVITFDELLKRSTSYFRGLGISIEHILVDELQDIGYLEYQFIQALNGKNYFFVGDDWQAIYGFKGGDVNIFLNLIKNKKWKTYFLETNYRSKKDIINKAELIIKQLDSDDIIDKRVKVFTDEKGKVTIMSKYKIEQVLKSIPKEELKDYFLLTRSNKQLFELINLLEKNEIPYSSFKKGEISLSEMREELNRDAIKILTVHTSKGLESKKVILYGNFPINQPPYLRDSSERKVMYVGMTRAMDELLILN